MRRKNNMVAVGELVYKNSNHQQTADFVVDGKSIVTFSATIDGVELPNYTSWRNGTVEEYQGHHVDIHKARLQFLQAQALKERQLVAEAVKNRPPVIPDPPEEDEDEEPVL